MNCGDCHNSRHRKPPVAGFLLIRARVQTQYTGIDRVRESLTLSLTSSHMNGPSTLIREALPPDLLAAGTI